VNVPFEKRTLKNGLDVIVHEDRRLPIVAVSVWYHVGSKNERPGKTGFRASVRAPDVRRVRASATRLF
jgi:zinc protease